MREAHVEPRDGESSVHYPGWGIADSGIRWRDDELRADCALHVQPVPQSAARCLRVGGERR